jgi:hypothetical protein
MNVYVHFHYVIRIFMYAYVYLNVVFALSSLLIVYRSWLEKMGAFAGRGGLLRQGAERTYIGF